MFAHVPCTPHVCTCTPHVRTCTRTTCMHKSTKNGGTRGASMPLQHTACHTQACVYHDTCFGMSKSSIHSPPSPRHVFLPRLSECRRPTPWHAALCTGHPARPRLLPNGPRPPALAKCPRKSTVAAHSAGTHAGGGGGGGVGAPGAGGVVHVAR